MMKLDSISIAKKRYDIDFESIKNRLIPMVIGFCLARSNVLDKLTPLGFAFLSAYIIMKNTNPAILISVIMGSLSFHGLKGMNYLLAYIFVYAFFKIVNKGKEFSLIKSSIITTTIFLLLKFLSIIGKTFFIYDLILICFEGILVFTMTYIFSFSVPIGNLKGNILNNEKVICSFITLALVLSGLTDLSILGISIKNILSVTIILYLSYNQGAFVGSTTGIILGMVGYISQPEMPFIISIFAIIGLLTGLFRDLGWSGIILGFLLGNGIVSYYINGLGTSFLSYREIAMTSLIFLITFKNINPSITKAFAEELGFNKEDSKKKDEIVIQKLNRIGNLFNKLSSTFRESAEDKDYNLTTEVYSLVDRVANNVCIQCENYEKCWDFNYYTTYNNFFNLVSLIEIKSINDKLIYDEAKKFCIKEIETIDIVDREVEKLKLNQEWGLKLKDNRILLSEQLEGVGNVIRNIANDIYGEPSFNQEIEENLYKDLKNNRIDVKEVLVSQVGEGDLEVFVDLDSKNISESKVKRVVSETLGFPVVGDLAFGSAEQKGQRFKLLRNNRYSAMTSMASLPNSEDMVSGDSFTFGEIENTYFSALSDGMGIGRRANEESKVAISLLERLMEANVDKNLTLKTINSVLRVKSNEEIFTTLDLSFIDLYTGKLQMIKTGSPATFIKKKDRIEVINSKSLPVGILKDVDFNIYEESIEDGDIIIMMSDGVLDAGREIYDREKWMKDIIINIDSVNPQIIANTILSEAKAVATVHRDDMTVLVTKVWKSI